jgi:hypothetical protein
MITAQTTHEFVTKGVRQWIDPRYHCVCVEQTDYRPILFEDVIKRIKEEGGEVGFQNGNGPTM